MVDCVKYKVDLNDQFDYFIRMEDFIRMEEKTGLELLTTQEAARLLGVGTTSVKRWAEAGVLACVKTPGGHRRYPRAAVEALLADEARWSTQRPASGAPPGVEVAEGWTAAWVALLISGGEPEDVTRALLAERDAAGSWWRVGDRLAAVLKAIGQRWAHGQLTVLQEHLASERLARGLTRALPSIVIPAGARRALLLVAPGDDHTLGLRLAELALREAGWDTEWAGRRTPIEELARFARERRISLVAVSASEASFDQLALRALATQLGVICRATGALLLLGGEGAWPDPPPYGHRLRSLASLPDAR